MSLQGSGSGELGRVINLVDRSKVTDNTAKPQLVKGAGAGGNAAPKLGPTPDPNGGIAEKDELGRFHGVVVSFVDETTEDGRAITKERHAFLQPRNWHFSEQPLPKEFSSKRKDRRGSVSLIADHEHEFDGWKIDEDNHSPFLDDWFYSAAEEELQKSTRLVDYEDKKGRTALLSQLVKIADDPLGEYTAALVMSATIGSEHNKAAAGMVWDNGGRRGGGPKKTFDKTTGRFKHHGVLAFLDSFFCTNGLDTVGTGREGTPHTWLSMRDDAHIDKGAAHGRIHFVADDIKSIPFGKIKYKSGVHFDTSLKNVDTELGMESGQWLVPYHCVDAPEKTPRRPPRPPGGDPPTIFPPPPEPPTFPPPPDPRTTFPPPPEPGRPPIDERIFPGLEELREKLDEDKGPGEDGPGPGTDPVPPTQTGEGFDENGGRIICLDLCHNPPLTDGVAHPEHGYIAISEDGKGGHRIWVDRPAPVDDGLLHFDDPENLPDFGADATKFVEENLPGWDPVISMPGDAPAGEGPRSDGKGGFEWIPVGELEKVTTEELVVEDENGETSYNWTVNDDGVLTLEGGVNETVTLEVDAENETFKVFEEPILTVDPGATSGQVPTADGQGNFTWQTPAAGSSPWQRTGTVVELVTSTDSVKVQSGKINSPSTGGANSQAFGDLADAAATKATAVGYSAFAKATESVALGFTAIANNTTGIQGTAVGALSSANESGAVAVGYGATVSAYAGVAIGPGAVVSTGGVSGQGVAIGNSADATADDTVALGVSAQATGSKGVALGAFASVNSSRGVAVGESATVAVADGVALGRGATVAATHTGSVAIGRVATTTAASQVMIGSATAPLTTIVFGEGDTDASPPATTLRTTNATGTDIAGANMTVVPSRGTGSANGGSFKVQVSSGGATGTTLRTATDRLVVAAAGTTLYHSDGSTKRFETNDTGVGFFGVTPAARQTVNGVEDASGGTASETIAAAGGTYDQTNENNFRASVADKLNDIRNALATFGLFQ